MLEIIKNMPVCHVEAPGQNEGAKTLPTGSVHCLLPSDCRLTLYFFHIVILTLFYMFLLVINVLTDCYVDF